MNNKKPSSEVEGDEKIKPYIFLLSKLANQTTICDLYKERLEKFEEAKK